MHVLSNLIVIQLSVRCCGVSLSVCVYVAGGEWCQGLDWSLFHWNLHQAQQWPAHCLLQVARGSQDEGQGPAFWHRDAPGDHLFQNGMDLKER